MFWIRGPKATAGRETGLAQPATSHSYRHAWAMHGREDGYGNRMLPEGLGHKALKTTRIYPPVLPRGVKGVRRPVDALWQGEPRVL